jgi:hypothetical protein
MKRLRCRCLASRFLPLGVLLLFPFLARADGGTIRLSEEKGNYRITAFTSPTPLRAGPVDISVLVQNAATGDLAAGVEVHINLARQGSGGIAIDRLATTQAATNKLYYAANFDLPEPGLYSVNLSIDGVLGKVQTGFEVEAAQPLPSWLTMLPWIGWPVFAIVLFGVHEHLVRHRSSPRPKGGRTMRQEPTCQDGKGSPGGRPSGGLAGP